MTFVLCSDCFSDHGLKLDASRIGFSSPSACPRCASHGGSKLDREAAFQLAYTFFVKGSVLRYRFGAAPQVQFNDLHYGEDDFDFVEWLKDDVALVREVLKIGFFHYGPRLWMVGDVRPLQKLQDPRKRGAVIERILQTYPCADLTQADTFYRLRANPHRPAEFAEYDSPPDEFLGAGRLDAPGLPVLYGSQDIEGCVHECKVTAEDELYLAQLQPSTSLRLLDLTALIVEEVSEFESLDMAVHMLFFAAAHSYEVTRAISKAARAAGFDGLFYPSYYGQVRSGAMPFETILGLSIRRLQSAMDHARQQIYPNIALFGRPVRDGAVKVCGINRLILHRASYDVHFGPAVGVNRLD